MITAEVQACMHLRNMWGRLVPHFKYFGHDWGTLWVFVTTYEGVSLSSVAKNKGGLTSTIKDKARAALRELHANGVVHGDPALRNVLWRERDQSVIWVDFELATVGGENFHALAASELVEFEKELSLVHTVEETDIVFAEMAPVKKKRTSAKVCCCPAPGSRQLSSH